MRLGNRGMGIMELAGLRTCFAGRGGRTELGKVGGTRRRARLGISKREGSRRGPSLQALLLRELSLSERELDHTTICLCSVAAVSVIPD